MPCNDTTAAGDMTPIIVIRGGMYAGATGTELRLNGWEFVLLKPTVAPSTLATHRYKANWSDRRNLLHPSQKVKWG